MPGRYSLFAFVMASALVAALGGQSMLCAQQAQAREASAETLKFVVILSRHGVRSPTKSNASLDPYSSQPWPAWEVAPGELTPRGAELLQRFGAFDRAYLAQTGLLSQAGCADAAGIYLWADTDHRTVASAKALGEGMYPGCAVSVHSLGAETPDPLFHPMAAGIAPPDAKSSLNALSSRLGGEASRTVADNRAPLELLARVLAPVAGGTPQKPLLAGVPAMQEGKGDHLVELTGPLGTASTLAEDLLLEYADGKPASEVGWGRVDAATLQKLLPLHTAYFDLMHRTPLFAQAEASNMLAHLLATLRQAETGHAEDGAIGPVGAKAVLLAGHDTNLAGLAALLQLHWSLDGREDDTPPGAQLSFELWEGAGKGVGEDAASRTHSIRVRYRVQTLEQMRSAAQLSLHAPPASELLRVPDCAPCTLPQLEEIGKRRGDIRFIAIP